MNILIVEDDENKRAQLLEFLRGLFAEGAFVETRSYQSGLKEILEKRFDYVLLDMSMPTYDKTQSEPGGRYRPFAGREIMAQMSRRRVNTPVVIVTQFESFGDASSRISLKDLSSALSKDFGTIYRGAVYYNPAKTDWPGRLAELLGQRV